MSLHACLLAKTQPGYTLNAAEEIKKIPNVGLVAAVTGPYDLLIIVQSDDSTALGKLIINEIQAIPGVKSTLTLVCVHEVTPVHWLTK